MQWGMIPILSNGPHALHHAAGRVDIAAAPKENPGVRRAFQALLAAAVCTLAAFAPQSAAAEPVAIGLHSGLDGSTSQYGSFGTWLGRKVTYRVVFCDGSNWDGIASPYFLNASWNWIRSDSMRHEVISMPMMPKDGTTFASIVRGEHDSKFASAARKINTYGIASRVIIRLAWEGNGDWYPWAYANDPAGFRAAFRRIVQVMKKEASSLRFEWNISYRSSRRGGPAHWTEGYPGDDVVDIVSMDIYDEWYSWESLRDGEAGLKEFRAFAIAHNKPEAYSEWSCVTKKSGGGDSAAFIANMAAWFAARPDGVRYQAYWNVSSDGPNGSIYGATVNCPNAAAEYKKQFTFPSAPVGLTAQ